MLHPSGRMARRGVLEETVSTGENDASQTKATEERQIGLPYVQAAQGEWGVSEAPEYEDGAIYADIRRAWIKWDHRGLTLADRELRRRTPTPYKMHTAFAGPRPGDSPC